MTQDVPIVIKLSGANVHDSVIGNEIINELDDDLMIESVVCDKGYDSNRIRSSLKDKDIGVNIPGKKNRKIEEYFDKEQYKLRHKIENLFGVIKENKRLAMRFDKMDKVFMGFIILSLIKRELGKEKVC